MPIIAIAVGFVGSAIGTAIGTAIGGSILGVSMATIGGVIGAGIAGGALAAMSGGSFGQGFLMGAVGSAVGSFLQGGVGGAAADAGSSASGMWGEAGSGISTASTAAPMAGLGEVASGVGTGFGELGQAANSTGSIFDAGTYNVGGGVGTASGGLGEATSNALGMPSTLNTGVTDLANNPLTNGGYEGTSPNNPLGSVMPSGNSPVGTVTSPMNSNVGFNTQPANESYSLMNPQPTQAGSSVDTSGSVLEGGTGSTPTTTDTSASTGGLRGAIDSSNNWLKSNLGIDNAINAKSVMGTGQYLMDQYQLHKLEKQSKGLAPLSFEQFRQQYSDPGAYKTAANQLAKSGHTGTLPILLANMNQRARGEYAKYLPGAQQSYFGTKADLASAKTRSLGNMFRNFATA